MTNETTSDGVPYETARAILEAFRRHEQTKSLGPDLFNRRIVKFENNQPYVEVRFDPDVADDTQRSAEGELGKEFVWKEQRYAIRFTRGAMAEPLVFPGPPAAAVCAGVRDGDEAEPQVGSRIGTVGWCFVLNAAPVGLSNWHVLCALTGGCVGNTVRLNGKPATVMHVKAPTDVPNDLDFALARLSDPASICGMVKGAQFDVPLLLSSNLQINSTDRFRWVGLHNTATDARLVGVADVNYPIGQHVFHLNAQLVFEDGAAHGGDSGSLAVRKSDNSATGLLVARDGGTVYANPICTILDWEPAGTQATAGGRFPIFTGSLP
jgi:hypothetical protein